MFVAVIDQPFGTSTFFCSKMTSPDSFVMPAVRYSHSTASYGDMPSRVKYRRNSSPFLPAGRLPFPSAFLSRTSSFMVVLLPYIVLFEADCARYRGGGTDQVHRKMGLKGTKLGVFVPFLSSRRALL